MKKLFYLLIAVVAVGMFACSDDKTELRWENRSGGLEAKDIKWVPANGNDLVDFERTLTADGDQTEWKEISDRSGTGICDLGGTEGTIETEDGQSIRLSNGSSETYEIRSVAKK